MDMQYILRYRETTREGGLSYRIVAKSLDRGCLEKLVSQYRLKLVNYTNSVHIEDGYEIVNEPLSDWIDYDYIVTQTWKPIIVRDL